MTETPRSLSHDGEWDVSVFECSTCGIDFFTEDHVPLTGLPVLDIVSARFAAEIKRAILHTITSTQH